MEKKATGRGGPHGTVNKYNNYKCRCPSCRAAWAAYVRGWKHRHGVRPRAELRYYRGPRGRRGFDQLTEQILDAAEKHSGRSWRDVVGWYARTHGPKVRFPKSDELDEMLTV